MTSGWKAKFTAASALGLMLVAPAAVGQTGNDYSGGNTTVGGELIQRTGSAEIGTGATESVQPAVGASSAAKVGGAGAGAGAGGGLAVTGGDIAGLVALGIGALGTGTVLVRRSRPRDA